MRRPPGWAGPYPNNWTTLVDHAGDTIPVIDPHSGQSRPAYIFAAVLGASSYTYADTGGARRC